MNHPFWGKLQPTVWGNVDLYHSIDRCYKPVVIHNSLFFFLLAVNCDCENTLSCDAASGVCNCPPGFVGSRCETPCSEGTYGANCSHSCTCFNDAECSHINGHCTCADGWIGSDCTNSCDPNFYGASCEAVCTCQNGAACDHVTGLLCLCFPIYQLPNCNFKVM